MNHPRLTVEHGGDGTVCIAPHGELDLGTVYGFDAEVRRLEEDTRPAAMVVDLRDVTFVDSAGLARLIAVAERARRRGQRARFVRGPRAVTRLFALTGLSAAIEWVSAPDELPTGAPPAA